VGTFLILVAIALFVAAIAVVIVAMSRSKKPKGPSARQDPLKFGEMPVFGPRQLGPGAIVSYGGIDHIVRGSVTLRQGPFVWWEHLLEGGSEPIWFSVEEDEGRLELAWWARRPDLSALQPTGGLVVDGVQVREIERGSASYTTEGTTGLPAGGDMDFIDYANDDQTVLLGFERWAPNMPSPGELTVYPAPPPATA
jgi:hypothetical protein